MGLIVLMLWMEQMQRISSMVLVETMSSMVMRVKTILMVDKEMMSLMVGLILICSVVVKVMMT